MIHWPDLRLPPINLWSLPDSRSYYVKIELGESYLTRSGMVMTIIDINKEHAVAITKCGQRLMYHFDGTYGLQSPQLDLITKLPSLEEL